MELIKFLGCFHDNYINSLSIKLILVGINHELLYQGSCKEILDHDDVYSDFLKRDVIIVLKVKDNLLKVMIDCTV